MTKARFKKFFITAINERLPDKTQSGLITLLNDNENLLINQYGKIFPLSEIGVFDISKEDDFGLLLFYPYDERSNDYSFAFISFDFLTSQINEPDQYLLLGDLIKVGSYKTTTNTFSKIVEIPFDYTSNKVNIQISYDKNYQFDEINLVHNQQNLSSVSYGNLYCGPLTTNSVVGLGTYYSYIENNKVYIDFVPNVSFQNNNVDFDVSLVSIANTNFSIEGEQKIKNAVLSSKKTVIPKSLTPVSVGVGSHTPEYQSSYYIAQCTDLTNNVTQLSELIIVNDRTQSYMIEYADLNTGGYIGSFSTIKSFNSELFFKPKENIDVEVVLYQIKISYIVEYIDAPQSIVLNNFQILPGISRAGTDGDKVTNFELTHKGYPIFERFFNASNSDIINLNNNTILLPNHFFVTGEKIKYFSDEFDENNTINSIGISETTVPGIGLTNKLPNECYVVKVDNTKIKLSRTAEDALKILPNTFNFESLGVGNIHKIVSTKQNAKSLISIDNIIQTPIIYTGKRSTLIGDVGLDDFIIFVDDISIFLIGDLISIDDEIMQILSIGSITQNSLLVKRNFLGTVRKEHISESPVKKIKGNYNIVNNKIYFTNAPYGSIPKTSIEDPLDEQDYSGLEISSIFDGRVFMRSGVTLSQNESYEKNYIFDDITDQFNGISKQFSIKSDSNDITGISNDNAVVLINNVYQSPKGSNLSNVEGTYFISENSGQSKIEFVGSGLPNTSDVQTTSVPYGGVIVSVGSKYGFGYQPLISAGGTAIVSSAGTISSISISNSGSGYRIGIQTEIKVGVQTYSLGKPNIEFIGTAIVSNGNIVDVKITNPGSGYLKSNPPEVVFDDPLGYVNIPLIYSEDSQSGIGTQATIDIVVGQKSDIIGFNINNYGYGYNKGDILTIPIDNTFGILKNTNTSFSEFQIYVDEIYDQQFFGWSMGQFEVLDNLDSKFNGKNKYFQISSEGKPISISKKKGSPIELEYVLLVFLNDVLQIPGKDYTFTGSIIKFNLPPLGLIEDPFYGGDKSKIIFYKGTRDIDVEFVDILDSPKLGDNLTISGKTKDLTQKSRLIELISSVDTVGTNKYADIGISEDEKLLRPVKWCKQKEDLYISGKQITKNRDIYEPYIHPISYLIKDIQQNDTEIFVDSLKLSFDNKKENIPSKKLNIIEVIALDDENYNYEEITNITKYEGDFGDIVGIDKIDVGDKKCLIFSLFVPPDSHLRNTNINTDISTMGLSGIQTGYRFVISGTKNGSPNTTLDLSENQICTGNLNTFLDNIYECFDYYIDTSNVVGIGNTNVTKVVTIVNDYDGIDFGFEKIYGKYSWGKITTPFRSNKKQFLTTFNTINQLISGPIIRRKNQLNNDLYLP